MSILSPARPAFQLFPEYLREGRQGRVRTKLLRPAEQGLDSKLDFWGMLAQFVDTEGAHVSVSWT